MANKTDGGTKGYIFQWKIENRSNFWWFKKGQMIESPEFDADALGGTKWSLRLFPMGDRNADHIALYLYRKYGGEPANTVVNFHLAILCKNGSFLVKTTLKHGFEQIKSSGHPHFVARKKVFVDERETFLPEDTLTIQCKIWKEEEPAESKLISARTVFKENRKSFVWRIDKFSCLKHGVGNKSKDRLIDFDLIVNEERDFQKYLLININEFDERVTYFSFKASIIDTEGKKGNSQTLEYSTNDLIKGVLSAQIFTEEFMEKNSPYFSNGDLSLDCESVIWAKTEKYECIRSVITPKLTNEVAESRDEYKSGKEKSLNTSVLVDLRSMYDDGIFSDMELRTSTKTFPVHKCILGARSPVFRSMFSSDMKEKISGHVDIADFEDDTVYRMLVYIYTDSMEDLKFETALKLYSISDKYQISSLKSICSSFLKDNLCTTSVCDVLDLAVLHSDDDLKDVVLDYLLGQPKEFFRSQEWKDIMNAHRELASDVMCKKICQE